MNEPAEALRRVLEHPELWSRLVMIATGVAVAVLVRAMLYTRVLRLPFPGWLQALQFVLGTVLLALCLADWSAVLKMSAVLVAGVCWGALADWRKESAAVSAERRASTAPENDEAARPPDAGDRG